MTPLALVPPDDPKVGCERPDGTLNIHSERETCEVCRPEDPRLAKLRALQEGPETDIEALGNAIMTLEAWAMLSDPERARSPGDEFIMSVAGRLAKVRQHLIDQESQ